MLKQLIQFEALYQLKQRSFIFLSLIFFFYGLVITADNIGEGMELLNNNSPYRLSFFISLTSVSAVLIASLFCVNSVLRDEQYQFDTITGFLSVDKRFISRLIIALVTVIFVVSLISLGMLAGLLSPELDKNKVVTIELLNYIKPWLIFVLPNAFFSTVFLFAVSYRWKSAVITYLSAVILFIVFWIFHIYIGAPIQGNPVSAQPEILYVLALIDPFGATAFFQQTQFFSPSEKNELGLSFDGLVMYNRIIWLSIASLILLRLNHRLAKPSLLVSPTKVFLAKFKRSKQIKDELNNPAFSTNYKCIRTTFNKVTQSNSKKYQWLTLFTMIQFEIKQMIIGWPFRIFIFIWILLVATGIYMVVIGSTAGEVSGRFPTTALLINQCTEIFSLFGLIMVVYYTAEKIWDEKLRKISPLINTTPISSFIIVSAKLSALYFIPFVLISVLVLIAICYQLFSGYYQFEFGHYLSSYYFFSLPIMIQTVFIFFIQTAFNKSKYANKYMSLLVSGLLLVVLSNLTSVTGLEHPLLQFNQFPDMSRVHTESVGYGLYAIHFSWYFALWLFLSVIFFRQTVRLWDRGLSGSVSATGSSLTNKQKIKYLINLSTLSFTGFLIIASLILHQLHWLNNYQTSADKLDSKESYERKYRQYQNLIVPQIINVKTKVDIFPEEHRVLITGDYLFQNTSQESINEIFVSSNHSFKSMGIEKTKIILTDDSWNIRLVQMEKPLLPGEKLKMNYQMEISSNPFAIDTSILSNGTHLMQRQFEPTFGYNWDKEIQSNFERRKRGLTDRTGDEFKNALHGGDPMLASEKSTFETIISTSNNQIAVTSGLLVNQWQNNNRNYYLYKTDIKTFTPLVIYFSAAYEIKKVNHQGIDIEMYYYPNHTRNIEEMITAASATLDYGKRHFGDYLYPSLRILEAPGNVGKASPGVITMGQDLYVRDSQDGADINTVARRTIHEVAHQWWGEKLNPLFGRGSGILIESLAMYMQAAVLEELYGSSMPQALAKRNQSRYFSGRAYAHEYETSLHQSLFEQYLIYSKGSVVLFAVRDLLGEDKFDKALNHLLKANQNKITANIDSLIQAFSLVSDEKQKHLINDWFTKIIEYDLLIKNAEVLPQANGTFLVNFEIHAARLLTENKGQKSSIGINEPLQIEILSQSLSNKKSKSIYLANHQINQAITKLSLIVDNKPEYIIIDPDFTRLDQNLTDNSVKLGNF